MRNNQTKAEQWKKVEAIAAKHGTATSRDNWRIATCVYLADSKEEAWRDVEASIGRDMEYFAAIGLKAPYEAYPGSTVQRNHPALRRRPARLDHRHAGRCHRADRTHAGGDRRLRRTDAHHP